MADMNNELSIEQLDMVHGGGDHNHTGPHTGQHDGLGWLRKIGSEIAGAVAGVVKTIFG